MHAYAESCEVGAAANSMHALPCYNAFVEIACEWYMNYIHERLCLNDKLPKNKLFI